MEPQTWKTSRATRICCDRKNHCRTGTQRFESDHYATSDQPIFELIEGEGDKAVSHPLFSIPEILREDPGDWSPRSADQNVSKVSANETPKEVV